MSSLTSCSGKGSNVGQMFCRQLCLKFRYKKKQSHEFPSSVNCVISVKAGGDVACSLQYEHRHVFALIRGWKGTQSGGSRREIEETTARYGEPANYVAQLDFTC